MTGGAPPAALAPRVLIGGVGYRWQGDASFGLVVADELASHPWPPGVAVADLGYGALLVVQDLAAADPPHERLVLLAAVPRGRRPGSLHRRRWQARRASDDEVQARIREAGAGVIDLEHLLVIAHHFDALPGDVVVIELEPADVSGGDGMSAAARAAVPAAMELARAEVLAPLPPGAPRRTPVPWPGR